MAVSNNNAQAEAGGGDAAAPPAAVGAAGGAAANNRNGDDEASRRQQPQLGNIYVFGNNNFVPLRDGVNAADGNNAAAPAQNDQPGYEVNEDGVIEGGVAAFLPSVYLADDATAALMRRSTDCDMVLYVECLENLQSLGHSAAKRGAVISIGLDKTTKLNAVFNRLVEFCTATSRGEEALAAGDLEFVHCDVLSGKETMEGSALMNNDRIKVRRRRMEEKEQELERIRMQRDSDRNYFKQMRSLLPELTVGGDVILDCRGKLVENGLEQLVLRTYVKAHSAIVAKRCAWLAQKIRLAKEERERNPVNKIPSYNSPGCPDFDSGRAPRQISHSIERSCSMNEDLIGSPPSAARRAISSSAAEHNHHVGVDLIDDEDAVQPYPMRRESVDKKPSGRAAEVVAEDDDEPDGSYTTIPHDVDANDATDQNSRLSPLRCPLSNTQYPSNMLFVPLEDHPPEAVKLLLEYCYTNRCTSLGYDAFVRASKGAVPPFHVTGWPKNGRPTVSISLALAAIRLAEEARLPRFSLMCEIAASHLVSKKSILEALSLCTKQYTISTNRLPILRKSAMALLLQRPVLMELTNTHQFTGSLREEREAVVPSLLIGTKEVLTTGTKRKPRASEDYFTRLDAEDRIARSIERHHHREKRRRASNSTDDNSASRGLRYSTWKSNYVVGDSVQNIEL